MGSWRVYANNSCNQHLNNVLRVPGQIEQELKIWMNGLRYPAAYPKGPRTQIRVLGPKYH